MIEFIFNVVLKNYNFYILKEKNSAKLEKEDGFVLIGDADILSKICTGVFFEVENQGVCMIGKKK